MVKYNFLFIGGAPRSGTTLVHNLLDDHPNILCFPFEHSTFENFFWHGPNRNYFENDFIKNRLEGQQSISASQIELDKYSQKILKEYKKVFTIDINPDNFLIGYQNYLKSKEITLQNILAGMAEGLIKGNKYAQDKKEIIKWVVFKQPYYTELLARKINNEIPNAKFIQMNRQPISRYTSAKKRRLTQAQDRGKRLSHINWVSFVEGHCEVGESSYQLGKSNSSLLGGQTYKNIDYEDLVTNPKDVISTCLKWIRLDEHKNMCQVTRLGEPVIAGSLFQSSTTVDSSGVDRSDEFRKITNWSERIVFDHLLYQTSQTRGGVKRPFILILVGSLIPFKKSSFKNYFFQLVLFFRLFYVAFDKSLITRLPFGLLSKKLTVSGAT